MYSFFLPCWCYVSVLFKGWTSPLCFQSNSYVRKQSTQLSI
jgi:hypothetical protein